jgi:glycosyltransferase involved in cell wall biosynthesis
MARPIVASPRGSDGAKVDTVHPWLVARSPDEWIDRIDRLGNDPAGAAELGQAARLWVEQSHSWAACAQRHEELILDRLAPGARPQAPASHIGANAA